MYYFDHAATTPLDPTAYETMKPYFMDIFANPSSIYSAARVSRQALEAARHDVANVFGAKPTEIVFTSGGTEGNNLAIQGVLYNLHTSAHWVTTSIEHDAVLSQIEPLVQAGFPCTIVPVKANGIVDPTTIIDAINDDTALVSVMLANNEIGTIQPLADIAKKLEKIRADRLERGIEMPLYLHTDAVQAANYLDLHVDRLGVDLLTLSGSKIYGPRGTGVLYLRFGTKLSPLLWGGGQERGRRSGTENVAGIVGFASALKKTQDIRSEEAYRLAGLRDGLLAAIRKTLPEVVINGDLKRRLPNNINLTIPGAEGEGMVLYLDNAGFLTSTGSACSSGSLDPSHVLLAIGRSKSEADQSLRLTLGRETTAEACHLLSLELPRIVKRLREISSI
jgi:cysteine desulfurase